MKLGEVGLIDRIAKKIKTDNSIIKGIGDDAAVIKWKRDRYLLFAADMVIKGVHFDLRRARPFEIGWKALGVNISDIAAMGGVPRYATVSLGLPKDSSLRFVDGFYAGLKAMAKRFGVNIVGGDTNSSGKIVIDVAVIGEVRRDELVLRSGAKIRDFIVVTGTLGGSGRNKHLNFVPRVRESRFLVRNFKINSMIDISDGLSSDLTRICESSRVGAKIYESLIPISKNAKSIKNALNDGEDFELLFTVSKNNFKELMERFKKRFKTPITAIGEIGKKDTDIKLVNRYGKTSSLKEKGFKHF